MRAIGHGDVVSTACAVLGLPSRARRRAVLRLLDQAHAADAYRKRFGRAHPIWGNGSLMAVARGVQVPGAGVRTEPRLGDLRYCRCLAQVFDIIVEWRLRRQLS